MNPETHVFKKADGLEIRADVYRSEEASGHRPVVAYFHGGALIMGDRTWINERFVRDCLEAGYVFVSLDYRLAPETKLPEIIDDARDGLSWIRSEGPDLFGADDACVAAAGSSAGGYLALMSGLFEWKPKAIVSFYGYGDLVGPWYSKPDPFYCSRAEVSEAEARGAVGEAPLSQGERTRRPFYLYCRQKGIWPEEISGHDPHHEPEFFKPYCPLQNVTAQYPPTMLLHGDADTDVPYKQSVMMADELAHAGVEHEFLTIPNGPHVFDKQMEAPVVDSAFEKVRAFLARHLG